mmetsp:Transcript_62857/g.94876  ORF Transcript_62857/g.94876 Transcript_62857/m.94876 type:complete len:150 (-) Transcript_62857:75-524(-)
MSASQTPNYYQILNCAPTASKQQITTEYHILARSSHPDKAVENMNDDTFVLANEAYSILSDDHARSLYDLWLGCGLNVSFQDWRNLNKDSGATMHWAGPVDPAKNAIDVSPVMHKPAPSSPTCRPAHYRFSPVATKRGSLLHQFRTYQI